MASKLEAIFHFRVLNRFASWLKLVRFSVIAEVFCLGRLLQHPVALQTLTFDVHDHRSDEGNPHAANVGGLSQWNN